MLKVLYWTNKQLFCIGIGFEGQKKVLVYNSSYVKKSAFLRILLYNIETKQVKIKLFALSCKMFHQWAYLVRLPKKRNSQDLPRWISSLNKNRHDKSRLFFKINRMMHVLCLQQVYVSKKDNIKIFFYFWFWKCETTKLNTKQKLLTKNLECFQSQNCPPKTFFFLFFLS